MGSTLSTEFENKGCCRAPGNVLDGHKVSRYAKPVSDKPGPDLDEKSGMLTFFVRTGHKSSRSVMVCYISKPLRARTSDSNEAEKPMSPTSPVTPGSVLSGDEMNIIDENSEIEQMPMITGNCSIVGPDGLTANIQTDYEINVTSKRAEAGMFTFHKDKYGYYKISTVIEDAYGDKSKDVTVYLGGTSKKMNQNNVILFSATGDEPECKFATYLDESDVSDLSFFIHCQQFGWLKHSKGSARIKNNGKEKNRTVFMLDDGDEVE